MKSVFTVLPVILLFSQSLFAQLDSIYDQNVWRTFIVHLPVEYNENNEYPLVLNLHGLGADAEQQQSYSKFDTVSDDKGFIVIYPNSSSNSWATNNDTDIDFLSHLVDTIRAKYSCNDYLFAMGMSQGGFMTYRFANSTPHTVHAVAVGSGNMSNATQEASVDTPQIPIMHFHGTEDNTVPYSGTGSVIPPVDSTIQWWVKHNNCNPTPTITTLPNISTRDNSTVEKYYYNGGENSSEVTFYKIIGGGHTWSGSIPFPLFGATNRDINQSEIIGDFFERFSSVTTNIDEKAINNSFGIYPNPFNDQLTITNTNTEEITFTLYNQFSQQVIQKKITGSITIDTESFSNGVYFYEMSNSKKIIKVDKLIKY